MLSWTIVGLLGPTRVRKCIFFSLLGRLTTSTNVGLIVQSALDSDVYTRARHGPEIEAQARPGPQIELRGPGAGRRNCFSYQCSGRAWAVFNCLIWGVLGYGLGLRFWVVIAIIVSLTLTITLITTLTII